MTVGTLITADELLQLPDDGSWYELVRGELRKRSPAGSDHGYVALNIGGELRSFVKQRRLGRVYGAETGFRLTRDPDTVRAPDAAFVRAERVRHTSKYCEGAPDLAVEVVSPNDRYTEIEEKTMEYLRAGTQAVVIVDPQTRNVRVHRASGTTDVHDVLELPDVLPGWKLPLAEIFD